MQTLSPRITVFWLVLLPLAFVLHLAWEYWQCQPFFVHGSLPKTWGALLQVTLGDVVLTAAAYGVIAGVTRNAAWAIERWNRRVWAALVGISITLGIVIEIVALAGGRWSYTTAAPLLPAMPVSVVPVLQLLILFPLGFGLARWITLRALRSAPPRHRQG